MAHLPRLWIPNQVMHGVIRTVDRAFLLIPAAAITSIIGACVGRALKNYPVQLHGCLANTNHIHFLLSVTEAFLGNGAPFFQYLNGLMACEINKYWGRTGHVWANRIRLEPCVDDEAAERMLAYIMSNPVKDDLVELASDWSGFSTHHQLVLEEPVKYNYINLRGWWKQGGPLGAKSKKEFQETVTVQTTPLPHWQRWNKEQRCSRYGQLIQNAETQHQVRREVEGKRVIGLPALLRQDPRSRPASEPSKGPKPLCHASSKKALIAFYEMWKEFLHAYREASAYYRSGIFDVEFPPGSFRPPLISVFAAGT